MRMAEIDYLADEIERMRVQVRRERRERLAAIHSIAAAAALSPMLRKIDDACAEGNRPKENGRDRPGGDRRGN